MKTFARIQNNEVAELITVPEGQEVTDLYHPDYIKNFVDVSNANPQPQQLWTYNNGQFKAPTPIVVEQPETTFEELAAARTAFVQGVIDAKAQSLGYDNILTAVSYAEEPADPKAQAEGQALRAWRSLVWVKCNEILNQVLAGDRDAPTEAELQALLPTFIL